MPNPAEFKQHIFGVPSVFERLLDGVMRETNILEGQELTLAAASCTLWLHPGKTTLNLIKQQGLGCTKAPLQ